MGEAASSAAWVMLGLFRAIRRSGLIGPRGRTASERNRQIEATNLIRAQSVHRQMSDHSAGHLAMKLKRSLIHDVSGTLSVQDGDTALLDNQSAAVLRMTHQLTPGRARRSCQ